jgi:hypothetical protein
LAAAESCLPPADAHGTVGADGTCRYANGTVVSFQPPEGLGPYSSFTQFEVITRGALCLSFANDDAGTGSSVTTQAGTVSLSLNPADESFGLVCPDGSTYTTGPRDAGELVPVCPGGFPSASEGFGGSGSPDGGPWSGKIIFSFGATGADGGTIVFDCVK